MTNIYTINGTREKDKLKGYNNAYNIINGYENDDTIKGGNLMDIIDGGQGNDSITGGTGTNFVKIYTKQSFGSDTITLTKSEDLRLQLADVSEDDNASDYLDIKVDGKNLIIEVFSEKGYDLEAVHNGKFMGKITIKNYTKKDVIDSGSFLIVDNDGSTVFDMRSDFKLITYMNEDNYTKSSFSGTWVDDYVDASEYVVYKKGDAITDKNTDEETLAKTKGVTIKTGGATYKNIALGSIYADTITGGSNDDIIAGGKGNDKITGGKGTNQIQYRVGDGDDIITLTKDENVNLSLTNLNLDDLKFEYSNKNKDLVISYSVLDGEGFTVKGSITLKDFGKKDVTGGNGSVTLTVEEHTYDLKNAPQDDGTYWYHITANNDVSASWLAGYIDASDAIEKFDKNGKHVNIKLTGSSDNDYIVGSNYADTINGGKGDDIIKGGSGDDTIKGGDGNDTIYGETGDDALYGEKGENLFVFNYGDGNDTLYAGKGTDTLRFEDIKDNPKNMFVFEQGSGKNNKDLIIGYNIIENVPKDTITIKNYYTVNSKGVITGVNKSASAQYVQIKNTDSSSSGYITMTLEGLRNIKTSKDYIEGDDYIFEGTDNSDVIVTGGNPNIIYGKDGNDFIKGGSKTNTIYGGDGDDTIYGNKDVDTIYSGSGYDYISAAKGNDFVVAGELVDAATPGAENIGTAEDPKYVLFNNDGVKIYAGDGDDKIWGGYGNDILSGEKGNDEIHAAGGNNWINGGEGNDTIYGGIGNDDILGGKGDDIVSGGGSYGAPTLEYYDGNLKKTFCFNDKIETETGNDTIYSYKEGTKDTTDSNSAVGILGGEGDDTIYAQSANNYIWDTQLGTFYSYIDQNTFIKDEDGVSFKRDGVTIIDNDILHIMNTGTNDDGAKSNLKIVFNVIANYDYDPETPQTRMFLGGDVYVLSNDELDNWVEQNDYKGISLYRNAVENVITSDGYSVTSTKIAQCAETISAWLTDEGRAYADVNDVLASGNEPDIAGLMVQFAAMNDTIWTDPS